MINEIKILQRALAECQSRLKSDPKFQPLLSIEAQLQYLIGIMEGRETDFSRLKEIIVGVYAAREFETRDMDFANLLYEVEQVVDLLKQKKM